mmetsp:Transcript_6993/g.16702  ORF Transcript_6993/g.16702 Transcript_6993/m.16702 type:complete len:571 (-) Transcript_6993:51-1763(-)
MTSWAPIRSDVAFKMLLQLGCVTTRVPSEGCDLVQEEIHVARREQPILFEKLVGMGFDVEETRHGERVRVRPTMPKPTEQMQKHRASELSRPAHRRDPVEELHAAAGQRRFFSLEEQEAALKRLTTPQTRATKTQRASVAACSEAPKKEQRRSVRQTAVFVHDPPRPSRSKVAMEWDPAVVQRLCTQPAVAPVSLAEDSHIKVGEKVGPGVSARGKAEQAQACSRLATPRPQPVAEEPQATPVTRTRDEQHAACSRLAVPKAAVAPDRGDGFSNEDHTPLLSVASCIGMPLFRIDEEPTVREPAAKRGVCWTACTGPLAAALRPRPPATKPPRSRPPPHRRGGRPRPQRPRPRSPRCVEPGCARGKGKSQRELDQLFAQLQSQLTAAWAGRCQARGPECSDAAAEGRDVSTPTQLRPAGKTGGRGNSDGGSGLSSPAAEVPVPETRVGESAGGDGLRAAGGTGDLDKVVDDVLWLAHVVDDRADRGWAAAGHLTTRARALACQYHDKRRAGEDVLGPEAAELEECKEQLVELAAMLKKVDLRPDSAGSGRSCKRSCEVSTACQSVEEVVQ